MDNRKSLNYDTEIIQTFHTASVLMYVYKVTKQWFYNKRIDAILTLKYNEKQETYHLTIKCHKYDVKMIENINKNITKDLQEKGWYL